KGGEAPVKCCESCGTYNHASVRYCGYCGTEFIIQTKLKQAASTQELIKASDEPVVEVFKVDYVAYGQHVKAGSPPMVKVSYYCGLRKFDEYVCPEHTNFAG